MANREELYHSFEPPACERLAPPSEHAPAEGVQGARGEDDLWLVTLTWRGRHEGEERDSVPVTPRSGRTFPGPRH
jgi:hypothetical protein